MATVVYTPSTTAPATTTPLPRAPDAVRRKLANDFCQFNSWAINHHRLAPLPWFRAEYEQAAQQGFPFPRSAARLHMADAAFIRSLPQADQRALTSAYGKIVYTAHRMFWAPPGLEEEEVYDRFKWFYWSHNEVEEEDDSDEEDSGQTEAEPYL